MDSCSSSLRDLLWAEVKGFQIVKMNKKKSRVYYSSWLLYIGNAFIILAYTYYNTFIFTSFYHLPDKNHNFLTLSRVVLYLCIIVITRYSNSAELFLSFTTPTPCKHCFYDCLTTIMSFPWQLTAVNDKMAEYTNTPGASSHNAALMHTLQRHRDILQVRKTHSLFN